MKYGIIYEIFKAIIEGIRYLSLVELFKLIAKKLNPKPLDELSTTIYSRAAVDIFITLKWLLLLIFFFASLNNIWSCLIIWYLIITNIHTYFYYHVWDKAAINLLEADEHCLRRRFINLLLAIAFSNISFAYLYHSYYAGGFNWGDSGITRSHAIWYSVSNSVAANYNSISPITDLTNSVSMVQLLITFLFVTIIVSRSIPQKS